jgi:hypothetical protein
MPIISTYWRSVKCRVCGDGVQDFSVPVMGFNDVIVAIGQCNKQHEAQVRRPKSRQVVAG